MPGPSGIGSWTRPSTSNAPVARPQGSSGPGSAAARCSAAAAAIPVSRPVVTVTRRPPRAARAAAARATSGDGPSTPEPGER